MKKENGFTLVEAIVALFIGSLMLLAIYAAVNSAQSSSSRIEKRVSAQQDARGALDLMAMEIQMASYNSFLTNIWVNPASCSVLSPNQNYKGIQEATANSITIEMDINDNGAIGDPNETIKYVYDSTNNNKYITRETNCGGGQPFLGADKDHVETKTVLVVNDINNNGVYDAGVDIPVFRYYNGSGTEIFPTTADPTPIPDIRRIEITLVADTSSSDQGTNTRRRIIYSTSVIPRNHIPVSPTY